MEQTKLSLKGMSYTTMTLLSKVAQMYGYVLENKSYRILGQKIGMSHDNVKYHFHKLERCGYLKIERHGNKAMSVYLDKDKVNQLLQWL